MTNQTAASDERLKAAVREASSDILKMVMEAMADPEGGIGIDQVYALVDGRIGRFIHAAQPLTPNAGEEEVPRRVEALASVVCANKTPHDWETCVACHFLVDSIIELLAASTPAGATDVPDGAVSITIRGVEQVVCVMEALRKAGYIAERAGAAKEAPAGELEVRHPQDSEKWRTVVVGLPIIRKLLNGEDVELETPRINLIPDAVLFNNRATQPPAPSGEGLIIGEDGDHHTQEWFDGYEEARMKFENTAAPNRETELREALNTLQQNLDLMHHEKRISEQDYDILCDLIDDLPIAPDKPQQPSGDRS